MSKFLAYWTLLVLVQIYGLAIYYYGETYGFNESINPTTIIAATLCVIGILGLIGRYLNNKDMKRGYCDSGITQERIDEYQKSKNVGHLMAVEDQQHEIKDREIWERDYEDDDDAKR
jgi:hypothetical protein